MKNNRILVAFLAFTAAWSIVGCKDDEISSGVNSSMPAPENLRIDESVISKGVISVVWDVKTTQIGRASCRERV